MEGVRKESGGVLEGVWKVYIIVRWDCVFGSWSPAFRSLCACVELCPPPPVPLTNRAVSPTPPPLGEGGGSVRLGLVGRGGSSVPPPEEREAIWPARLCRPQRRGEAGSPGAAAEQHGHSTTVTPLQGDIIRTRSERSPPPVLLATVLLSLATPPLEDNQP